VPRVIIKASVAKGYEKFAEPRARARLCAVVGSVGLGASPPNAQAWDLVPL